MLKFHFDIGVKSGSVYHPSSRPPSTIPTTSFCVSGIVVPDTILVLISVVVIVVVAPSISSNVTMNVSTVVLSTNWGYSTICSSLIAGVPKSYVSVYRLPVVSSFSYQPTKTSSTPPVGFLGVVFVIALPTIIVSL